MLWVRRPFGRLTRVSGLVGEHAVGKIINVTTGEGGLPDPLTETDVGGVQSGAYLADGPAIDVVTDDETVAFVATNRTHGIAMTADTTRHALPDSRYRTVVVVTDRRVIGLVGRADGDKVVTLDVSAITEVTTTSERRTGQLTLVPADGPTWTVRTGARGLSALADYLRQRCETAPTAGGGRPTTDSVRGLLGATVDTVTSLTNGRMAELLPMDGGSPPQRAEGGRGTVSASPDDSTAAETGTAHLGRGDTETATARLERALAGTDWTARRAKAASPFNLLAAAEDELMGIVVHCPEDGRLSRPVIERCDRITGAAGTDTVMLATTGTVRDADERLAEELGVRLVTQDSLALPTPKESGGE